MANAVLDPLRIVKKNGSNYSCQTFENVLNYGKTLLLASHNSENNIDREIVLTLWPTNWSSVQKFLKKEKLYEDAKLFLFAFVEIRRNKQ